MNRSTGVLARAFSLSIGLAITAMLCVGAGPAAAAPIEYGNGCTLYPDNPAATADSLRFRCTSPQTTAIYLASTPGLAPNGVKNGWVTYPDQTAGIAPGLWIGKTFHTGPFGGWLQNRLTAAGIEGWQADVYLGPSLQDNKLSWVLNYAPSPTPPLIDEIREVSPGVWMGYSYWRSFQNLGLLAFVLA